MSDTTVAVQAYLRDLQDISSDSAAEPIIRLLLARACDRLCLLCRSRLLRNYPRLTRPPQNLEVEDLLSAAVERLIKALRSVRPGTPRQFFALANQHIRWELNDLARRLDERPALAEYIDAPAVGESHSTLSMDGRRIFEAIDGLPEEEREAFELIRIQGMTYGDAAEVLDVSAKTIQRRLTRALVTLSEVLSELDPGRSEFNEGASSSPESEEANG